MKVNFTKQPGGALIPSSDADAEKMTKLSNGEPYEVDIKLKQNGRLHRKVFAFFAFCTQHYYGDSEAHKNKYQLDYVRGELTKIAGYYEQVPTRHGQIKIIPRSINYDNMPPEERSDLYNRLIDAALRTNIIDTSDQNVLNQLYNFF